jgi:diguanylate cyclase (GGDEF)-like protein/PAS domain S-box-containing protein
VTAIPGARSTQRLLSAATYVASPLALVGVWLLRGAHIIAQTPLWVFGLLIALSAPANLLATAWLRRAPDSAIRIHARVAATVLSTAAVIYAAGWGSVLIVAYALGTAEMLRTAGPSVARANMIWTWVAIASGEAAVQLGWAPSQVTLGLSHSIAITGGIALAIVNNVLSKSASATEVAETRLRERGLHFEELIKHATDVIGVVTRSGLIHSMSPAITPLLGYSQSEVQGQPISRFLDDHELQVMAAFVRSMEHHQEVAQITLRVRHRDGTTRLVATTLSSPPDWGDLVIVNLRDITRQSQLEAQLRHDASHDSLTGLLNRKSFGEECELTCANEARMGQTVGMLYIDLDGFKQINDSFGHDLGDAVLIETARRLSRFTECGHRVARLGGDEFAVLVEAMADESEAIDLAERILDAVSRPIPIDSDTVQVGASIGIALRSDEGIEMSTLIREADQAMYAAKRNGRSRWELRVESPDQLSAG